MAKRRRGFDRRPATPPASRPVGGSGRPQPGAAGRPRGSRGAATPGRRLPIPLILAGVAVVVAAAAVAFGGGAGPGSSPSPAASGSPLAVASGLPTASPEGSPGIPCEPTERIEYHVHAHLNIRFAGELQDVAPNVGLPPPCFAWLHTHGSSGIIHVEAPVERVFTLGQFFNVWTRPLTTSQVLDRTVQPGESMFVFVDGQPYTGDPRDIELKNLQLIDIQIGTEALDPLPYTFPAEYL